MILIRYTLRLLDRAAARVTRVGCVVVGILIGLVNAIAAAGAVVAIVWIVRRGSASNAAAGAAVTSPRSNAAAHLTRAVGCVVVGILIGLVNAIAGAAARRRCCAAARIAAAGVASTGAGIVSRGRAGNATAGVAPTAGSTTLAVVSEATVTYRTAKSISGPHRATLHVFEPANWATARERLRVTVIRRDGRCNSLRPLIIRLRGRRKRLRRALRIRLS